MANSSDQEVVLAVIRKYAPGCSFVDLAQGLPAWLRFPEDATFMSPSSDTVLLWAPLSRRVADALRALLSSGRVTMKTTPSLTYRLDGCTLSLPLARNLRHDDGTTTMRWCPVVFDVKEY